MFVFGTQHVGKFGDFLTLLGATDKLFAHDGELYSLVALNVARNNLLNWLVQINQQLLVFIKTDAAELIGTDTLLAHNLMLD